MSILLLCKVCSKQILNTSDPMAGERGRQEVKYCSPKCRHLRHNKYNKK